MPAMEGDEAVASAEAEGTSHGEAKWSAIRALEPDYPGISAEHLSFEVLDEGSASDGRPARVVARVDVDRWHGEEDLPDDPAERVRAVILRVTRALGLRASVDIEETDDELHASVNGEDLGLLIGKHGSTIDALQHLVTRIAYHGADERKLVVVDAAGYRERREGALKRAADQAVTDALDYGRPVELEPMSSSERRIVHEYLRDRSGVQTHSEGDEPDRRLVVSPLR